MKEKIKACISAIQEVLREHGCVLGSGQHYSDWCWIEVCDGKDSVKVEWITADEFDFSPLEEDDDEHGTDE